MGKKKSLSLLRRGRRINHMTVSRRLSKEFNMKPYKPAKKPRLTAAIKTKRLQFANNHQHWTAEQWGKVLFFRRINLPTVSGSKEARP